MTSPSRRHLAGVALVSATLLMTELALTRIFSVVMYYHFAFLAISIALFGVSASGVFAYVMRARLERYTTDDLLSRQSLIYAIVTFVALFWLVRLRVGLSYSPHNLALMLTIYALAALPFFAGGLVVTLAISRLAAQFNAVYAADLIGAAGGCLMLIPLLDRLGAPGVVLAAAALTIAAAMLFASAASRPRIAAAGVVIALIPIAGQLSGRAAFDVVDTKGHQGDRVLFSKWNSFSRIGVYQRTHGDWSLSTAYTGALPETRFMDIDSAASTPILHLHPDLSNAQYLRYELTALAYQLKEKGLGEPSALRGFTALVIGPGGGRDLASALVFGASRVDGVEINPIIANTIMRGKFAEESRRIYFRPEVRMNVEDGRSFVRRSPEKYQVIQATLVDTWASTAAGAFALSENNLYTTDAFHDYLTHLTDDGVMAFTRWGFDPPRESLRLLSLAIEALNGLGEPSPWKHVMVVREWSGNIAAWGARDTVLVSRKPFSAEDVANARTKVAASGMESIYMPGDRAANPFGELLLSKDTAAYERNYRFDITPVGDDRPFFFYTVQPRDLVDFLKNASQLSADYKINKAVPLLFGVVAISTVATLVILALPPLLLGTRLPREPGVAKFLLYFLCIGVGYILIQVALIQKFVLFLGHPTYALTVIVFSMLVASSLGSFASRKLIAGRDEKLAMALGAVTVTVSILAFVAAPLTTALVGLPLPLKMLLTAVLIAIPAFCMGMPFPTGLGMLERFHKPSVRWAWSLNAAASVLGSAGAIFLAIYLGLRNTLLVGGALYFCALAIVWSTRGVRSHTRA